MEVKDAIGEETPDIEKKVADMQGTMANLALNLKLRLA